MAHEPRMTMNGETQMLRTMHCGNATNKKKMQELILDGNVPLQEEHDWMIIHHSKKKTHPNEKKFKFNYEDHLDQR